MTNGASLACLNVRTNGWDGLLEETVMELRVVTYNVHRRRADRRATRIVEVLREINADIIALQEVESSRCAA